MPDRRPMVPYGAWESPVSADLLAGASVRLAAVALDRGDALWLEGRPAESGRNVVVRQREGVPARDVTPVPWNVRSRVHEYGGGAFAARDGHLWFVHDDDQRLYALAPGGVPRALTPGGGLRFADPAPSPRGRWIACVCEDHGGGREPQNSLVLVDQAGNGVRPLASGHDFYATPRWSPDGRELAYLAWDHPNMPWDGTTLYRSTVAQDGTVGPPRVVAGGPEESIFQPEWGADGALWFASDAGGFWNLHLEREGSVYCVIREPAEYGLPQWQFAMSTYGFVDRRTLAAASCVDGRWRVEAIALGSLERTPMPTPVTEVVGLSAGAGEVVVLAASEARPLSVLRWRPGTGAVQTLRASSEEVPAPEWIPPPEALTFPTSGEAEAHAFFYPPTNPRVRPAQGERPPLVVLSHGGPTGATTASLDLGIVYWTSRGFAVLDVNYRGSTGYGRAYRRLLDGGWGVVDVADCVHGARFVAAAGRVDSERMVIRGRSAGGFTVLSALVFHDVFAAGASYYGIGELEALARDTHKFEARYLDRLLGPYPERADLYRERSPINSLHGLSCPVIFFHGLEDKVVPVNQARMMVDALRAKGIAVACLLFEGEQHGFRRAETIVRAAEAELYFYGRVLGFRPAGDVPTVAIENLAG